MATAHEDLRDLKEQQRYDFKTEIDYAHQSRRGLGEDVVRSISALKNEPQWMLDFRLKALDIFNRMPMPTWGVDLGALDFEEFYYFMRAAPEKARTWDDVPDAIKDTFDKLGIPEAERKFLAGVETQMDSEAVYSSLKAEWESHGIIFVDMDTAVQKYPDLVRKYISTVVPIADNKFAALNSAFWSGGSFVYVPPGVNVEIPLQAYFRINAQSLGQFERTIIIAEEGSNVHYIEGCFLAGSRVATRDGLKPIETIVAGDEVITHTGRYRKVYHTMRRPYNGKIYTIRYFGDTAQELRVTEEHPFLAVKRQRSHERNRIFDPQWLPASELSVGDYLVIPVRQPVSQQEASPKVTITLRPAGMLTAIEREVNFPQEPEFYRLLGYFFSEGHISKEHYLTLSFGVHETAYIQDAITLLTRYGNKAPIENAVYQNGQTLVLCSTEIARAFAYEFGSTAYDKHVPDWVLESPLPLLREFVRGMWRGDVSYGPRKNMFRYNSISRSLAYAFRDALLRLGIPASVNMQHRKAPRQPIYAVIIASPYNAKFGEIVGRAAPDGSRSGSPFYLDAQYLYVPIRSITVEDMQTEVYNFSVEEDESYLCEGVISHNCTAPQYTTAALHTGVIEIFVGKGAQARYTTIQNWSTNVYNLVTQRAVVEEDGAMAWVDGNLGCLAEGSTVTTPAGVRPIEALEVGDEVLSFDEASGQLVFRKVLAKRFSGYQRVREVSYGERRLRVTDNHPFYSYLYTPERAKKLGRYQLAYVRADHLSQAIVPRRSVDFGSAHRLKMPEVELPETVEVVDVTVGEPSAEDVPTWDIEVEGTGNFVAEGFIVHNSGITMKYPAVVLKGPRAHGEVLSIAFAGDNQHYDAGAKAIHLAPHTSSLITSKSISKGNGRADYRGLVRVAKGAVGAHSKVTCDALLLDPESRTDTYPYMDVNEDESHIEHEATVSKISEDQLFYLMSRGLPEKKAAAMIVSGFLEPFVKELPMEYAVELNRLIDLQMEGSVG